jgi:hypothetical protein
VNLWNSKLDNAFPSSNFDLDCNYYQSCTIEILVLLWIEDRLQYLTWYIMCYWAHTKSNLMFILSQKDQQYWMLGLERLSIKWQRVDVIRSSLDSCKLRRHGRNRVKVHMTDQR